KHRSPMKILMISPQPFFEPRGTPISVYQRLEALSSLGHEIDLITYHVGKDVELPNLKIHRVRGVKVIQHVRIGPSRAKILLDVQIFFKAIFMLFNKKYDVIHSHEEAAFFSMFLAWIFHTRHLYDMHSVLSNQLTNFSFGNHRIFVKIFEILEKIVLKTCHAVITVGPDLEKYVRSVGDNIRVVMIENIALHAHQTPVQLDQVKQLEERFNLEDRLPIVYTGTYERYQGLDMALKCVDEVRKKYPNVLFIFVGAKVQQAQEWTEKAERMGLGEHTLFLDVVSPEESMVYLACASVLISPRLDGTSTPLKIYSYLHAEKPIVATSITSHTQVLSNETALLVKPDHNTFAEGILRVLDDPKLARQLGKNAHQLGQDKFGRQDYITKVNQIYKTLVSKSKIDEPVLSQEK
ncbi:MAG TPA: glycosyltransferase, partial [Anaerolineales bacterium]|nr:glycosyltransferase [Anaerolineales bacterium]